MKMVFRFLTVSTAVLLSSLAQAEWNCPRFDVVGGDFTCDHVFAEYLTVKFKKMEFLNMKGHYYLDSVRTGNDGSYGEIFNPEDGFGDPVVLPSGETTRPGDRCENYVLLREGIMSSTSPEKRNEVEHSLTRFSLDNRDNLIIEKKHEKWVNGTLVDYQDESSLCLLIH